MRRVRRTLSVALRQYGVNPGGTAMLWKLVLLLTVLPVVELFLLVKLTQATSLHFTLLLILGTGVLGAVLARAEGLRVVRRIRDDLLAGKVPADALLDGAMLLVAGALLVTPGALTDAIGLLLLLPPSRVMLRRLIKRWIRKKFARSQVTVYKEMGFGPIRDEPPAGAPPMEDEEPQ